MKNRTLFTAMLSATIAGGASAAVIEVVAATAHNGGNWPSTLGHISDSVNGNGSNTLGTGDHNPQMDITADPNDPSTWLNVSGNWQSEWLANGRLSGATNSKIGYFIVDFGSAVANLENMYLWAAQHNSPGEDMRDYNVYIATAPSVAIPAMPNSQSWANGSEAVADYNFGSGGWGLIHTDTLASPSGDGVTDIVSFGGATARYVGIEILTAENGTIPDRVGFGQVEFTAVPEPDTLALLGLGGLMMVRRRRA